MRSAGSSPAGRSGSDVRMMSFALTTDQVRARTKTVTRRVGWRHAKTGMMIRPVVQAQGIPKGGKVEWIDPAWFITIVLAHREPLDQLVRIPAYGVAEMALEGFPGMDPRDFVTMFCKANGCKPDQWVTRIRFVYVRDQGYHDDGTPAVWKTEG